jgi:hypothetical protein
MRLRGAMVLVSLACASPALADTPLALYLAGKYQPAIDAAVNQNTAAGFALASRAALAEALMKDTPCLSCLERAEGYARRAVAQDASVPEGHIYLAVSLGYEARILGVVQARLKGMAEEAKSNLDAALKSDPGNAWALTALGGWNIEVVRSGGPTLARWLYGASASEGVKDFEEAFRKLPGEVALRYQAALSLSGYDLAAYRKPIQESLSLAVAGTPISAYERFAQGRARELLDTLAKNDLQRYAQLVHRDQGYP